MHLARRIAVEIIRLLCNPVMDSPSSNDDVLKSASLSEVLFVFCYYWNTEFKIPLLNLTYEYIPIRFLFHLFIF